MEQATPTASEAEALRARIAELERENAELAERAVSTISDAQEKTYWLQRWQFDIEAIAAKPAGARALRLLGKLAPRR
jgi:hypothetical protein